jgi:hypothetical protein
VTASDQESFSDIMLRLVGLYREVAQAAAVTYQHVKQAADLFEIDPVHPEGFAALCPPSPFDVAKPEEGGAP